MKRKKRDPKYNPKTGKATYPFSIPSIEIRGSAAEKYDPGYGAEFLKELPPKKNKKKK